MDLCPYFVLVSITYCIYEGGECSCIDHLSLYYFLHTFYSDRIHDETLGDDKVRERCLGGSWRDGSCVMHMFYLVMLGFTLYM